MKKLLHCCSCCCFPLAPLPPSPGMDDVNANIPPETQEKLDDAITTYYQHPTVEKVETVLDIMNDSRAAAQEKRMGAYGGIPHGHFRE